MPNRRKKLDARPRPAYLRHLAPGVREEFADATTLAAMANSEAPLSREERALIVQQALILIEQNYAHLPLKRAMHAVDPVQRLRLLLQEIQSGPAQPDSSDLSFHGELTDIFTGLRDLHTNYLLPQPWAGMVAFLPFMVEDCFESDTCRYLVSRIVEGFQHPTFVLGVEVTHWNGTPIERAVQINAQRFAGSNSDARHARGVQNLTTRALRVAPPPDEEWIVVGYRTINGDSAELRFDWVTNPTPSGAAGAALSRPGTAAVLGIDMQQQLVQRTRAALFAPATRIAHRDASDKLSLGVSLGPLESSMPGVIAAEIVYTNFGKFGYVRIRSFNASPENLIPEFARLIKALPKRGLIIDVRGNGGGIIHSGEYLLQLLTANTIVPQAVQFINTPLNLRICTRNDATSEFADLSAWTDSMRLALQTGSAFSAGFPISDPEKCNAIGQRYFGPTVLITDALCYSTTDIFAAGYQDHDIGTIIGTHRNTGAGGANVWEHRQLLRFALHGADSVYRELPREAGMRVSMRRTLRVGKRSGTPVEDLGVIPDIHYKLTPQDILGANAGLKNAAAAILSKKPIRDVEVQVVDATATAARLRIAVKGIDRIDAYVDDRPQVSIDVGDKAVEVRLRSESAGERIVEIRGFDDGLLVARYRVAWDELVQTGHSRASTSVAKGATKGASTKRARGRAVRNNGQLVTPNAGDDSSAVAELSFAAFGGASVTLAGAAVSPSWRAAKCLLQLIRQVDQLAPQRSKTFDGLVGDAAHQAKTSDHNPWVKDGGVGVVTAVDITHDPGHGCDSGSLAESIRVSHDARVKYIIWNRRIASVAAINGVAPWTWRPYNGENPHDKHVHISVLPEKKAYDSEVAWTLPK